MAGTEAILDSETWYGMDTLINQGLKLKASKKRLHRTWGLGLLRVNQIQWPSGCGCFLTSVWWIWLLLVPLQIEQTQVRAVTQPLAGHRGQSSSITACSCSSSAAGPVLTLWVFPGALTCCLRFVHQLHMHMSTMERVVSHIKGFNEKIGQVQSSVTTCLHVTSYFIPPFFPCLFFLHLPYPLSVPILVFTQINNPPSFIFSYWSQFCYICTQI